MKRIIIVDSTLRDGSHAVRHQFTVEQVEEYAKAADEAKVGIIVVGHGNGLGGSSLQIGKSRVPDLELLAAAKKHLKNSRLGVFVIPGLGTVKDEVEPAMELGAQVIFVGSHCTEADTTQKHIASVKEAGRQAIGVLMMSHMASADALLVQAKKMEEYGAEAVMLMDSAGSSLPQDVTEKVSKLFSGLSIAVGYHAHDNLGMAVANSLSAAQAGATFIDTTCKGIGAGAGNCPTEVVAAVLSKAGHETGTDLFKLMDNSDRIAPRLFEKGVRTDGIRITSGLAGVFSGFCPIAEKTAARFGIDAKELLMELGRRKVVAGQEDYITSVAIELARKGGNEDAGKKN